MFPAGQVRSWTHAEFLSVRSTDRVDLERANLKPPLVVYHKKYRDTEIYQSNQVGNKLPRIVLPSCTVQSLSPS